MSQSSRRRGPSWTARLVALAEDAAADTDPEAASAAEHRLAQLVERLIDRDAERPILSALDALNARHAHEAAELLQFWADDSASTLDVTVTSVDGPAVGNATLFLVPIILAVSASGAMPLAVPPGSAWDALVHSFREHELISPGPSLALAAHLYRFADLPRSWVARRQWLKRLLASLTDAATGLPSATADDEDRIPIPRLRFLLGVVVGTDDDVPVWEASAGEAVARDRRLESWQYAALAVLQEALGSDVVLWVGPPGFWTDALEAGVDDWNHLVLASLADQHRAAAPGAPEDILADVRWHPDKGWVVTLSSVGYTSPSFAWLGLHDPSTDRDDLLDALRTLGIRRIALDERDCPC
jgi:hypothetical protein